MKGAEHESRSHWFAATPDPQAVEAACRCMNCPPWYGALLVHRGLADPDVYARWIAPKLANLQDPLRLPDVMNAVDRILAAIDRSERITIFGDYDVDGITASALVYEVLAQTGALVSLFLPERLEEGYGLSREALKRCIEETGPNLIITVDCGTSSVESVQDAARAGIDVIITDHHMPGPALAPAVAVVNPRRSTDETMHVLAGVGVAFKLCHALLKVARQRSPAPAWAQFDIRRVIDLVALGTVADMVPLLHENRILVSFGFKEINRSPRPGIKALIDAAGIKKKVGVYEIGFQIAPRLNAAGRLGTARTSLDLLTLQDPAMLDRLARELSAANRERQEVEKETVSQLIARIEKRMQSGSLHSIVEADRTWHPGVVGLAATRAMQKFGRPIIVIGSDDRERAKGSGRSIPEFNLVEALDQCRAHLVKHGGHAMAAGLEISWDEIEAFRLTFESIAFGRLKTHDFRPKKVYDGVLPVEQITDEALALIELLAPFGMANQEPVWMTPGLAWHGPVKEAGKGHLKGYFQSPQGRIECIGFGLFSGTVPECIDGLFSLRRDEYMGRARLVMHLKDLRATGS